MARLLEDEYPLAGGDQARGGAQAALQRTSGLGETSAITPANGRLAISLTQLPQYVLLGPATPE
jgi:hypothetical protein